MLTVCAAQKVCKLFAKIAVLDKIWIVLANQYGYPIKSSGFKTWKEYFKAQFVTTSADESFSSQSRLENFLHLMFIKLSWQEQPEKCNVLGL